MLVRTFLPLPPAVLSGADTLQTVLLAMALFGLGSAVRLRTLRGDRLARARRSGCCRGC